MNPNVTIQVKCEGCDIVEQIIVAFGESLLNGHHGWFNPYTCMDCMAATMCAFLEIGEHHVAV